MDLPKVENPDKYTSLYVIDFGDYTGVGFTAREVAELLESEKFRHIKIYKIHGAYPDGRMELKGIPADIFQLEAGMFFYAHDLKTAQADLEKLTKLADSNLPPSRAKAHLAKYDEHEFVTALIYPAEYDDQFSKWLLDAGFKTAGPAAGGIGAVQSYYENQPEILQTRQFFAESAYENRTGDDLLRAVKIAVQR